MSVAGSQSGFLAKILAHKREEVRLAKDRVPVSRLHERAALLPRKDLRKHLRAGAPVAVIAEMKKASPSAGVLRPHFEPEALAKTYAANGAAAISVLTDARFFQGSLEHLELAKAHCELPLVRKDFVIDPYQIFEAAAHGADAVLLIVACLDISALRQLLMVTKEIGMQAVVEVHDQTELDIALAQGAEIIGINNRNLHTFEIDLETTVRLAPQIPPDRVVIAESGIKSRVEVERLAQTGIDAILVGSHLMSQPDPGVALKPLTGVSRVTRESVRPHPR